VKSFPRHFNITPEGHIVVACQKGNAVQTYIYSGKTMLLVKEIAVELPTVIVFI